MKKIQKIYHDHGFGFPVTLFNVPMVRVRQEWIPNLNQKELQLLVLEALALKPSRLSGNEVHFLRVYSQMTLKQFASRFNVSHPAVMKWEKAQNQSTGMTWATEKDIRLFILKTLDTHPKKFLLAYEKLTQVASAKAMKVKIDITKIPA